MADPDLVRLPHAVAARWLADHLDLLPYPDLDSLADTARLLAAPAQVTDAVLVEAQRQTPRVVAWLKRELRAGRLPAPTTPEETRHG